jgi:hypothetical protein
VSHAPVLALLAAVIALAPLPTFAQMGQSAMTPNGGVLGRAVAGFQGLNANGPGWLYYGINAADRGLGYRGSYMTAGGFIPVAEDDLGGFWSADLRSHLSEYGGFFSNVGAVRKQFIGGTLLGFGVYWDYDGDQSQYSNTPIPAGLASPYIFAGGYSYNQVGVSGEWLTDWGNLRSNGYIPLGTTAQTVGPFLGHSILCVNGVNAALGGADLELGAYIPGLSDWAGMISAGGYAFGNTRYNFQDGAAAVPWFGGVYTRLDMTFLENWDFSLQANNDSYFDWTGFARLTYRMGGSRRRNVPDQMEQPMMRNEHIVRARQTPVAATNPVTGDAWKVFHVDNTAAPGGAGTAESPFASLQEADGAATAEYDIVYVRAGSNSPENPYVTPAGGFRFNAANQYLIGEGSSLIIPTESCGDRAFFLGGGSSLRPLIANPIGPALAIDQDGAIVDHFQIVGSPLGISDRAGLPSTGSATISDVIIQGDGITNQRGIHIANSSGTFTFTNISMRQLTNDGLVVSGTNAAVRLDDAVLENINGTAIRVTGSGSTVEATDIRIADTAGTAIGISGPGAGVTVTNGIIAETAGNAVVLTGSATSFTGQRTVINDTEQSAIVASGPRTTISGSSLSIARTGSTGVVISGNASEAFFTRTRVQDANGRGLAVTGADARLFFTGSSSVLRTVSEGVLVTGDDATVLLQDSSIQDAGTDGVGIYASPTSTSMQVTLQRTSVTNSEEIGVYAQGVDGPNQVVQIFGSSISVANLAGIAADASNVDIGRANPQTNTGVATSISDTGVFGITMELDSNVRIRNTTISDVTFGIDATNGLGTVDLTATNNTINVADGGTGIAIAADVATGSRVNAQLLSNTISGGEPEGISLTTINPPPAPAANPKLIGITDASNALALGALNFNTIVLETPQPDPVAVPPQPTLIQWNLLPYPTLPPQRPVPAP